MRGPCGLRVGMIYLATHLQPAAGRGLRILHILSSLNVGGMEQFVMRLAAAQIRRGYAVNVLALHGGPLISEAAQNGICTQVLSGRSRLTRAFRAGRVVTAFRPNVIHAHNQTSLHYATLGKKLTRARVVMTNHGQGQGSPRTPSASEWASTDAVVAVSRAVADRMSDAPVANRLSVIVNGVVSPDTPNDRLALRRKLGIADDEVVGIIVARIDGLKGHELLLWSLTLLPASTAQKTRLLVAGDGAKREAMEELAHDLKLGSEKVLFLGHRRDVSDLLSAADFFALPSLMEGLPLSMLEAMAHRLPVVATPVGGIPELVEEGTHGLLTPVDDAKSLAMAIERLVEDPRLRRQLGDNGRRRVEEEFGFERMIDSYEELYCSLLI